jgi:hypothetical protein
MLDYISVQQAANQWGISKRRIQKLCEENRIAGAVHFGRAWAIPKDTEKPADARRKHGMGNNCEQRRTESWKE